ncbi:MAG: hypothetical protein JJU29_03990 [Verrucomicrobia bacterium]|nr:hypothetical protein [Verrucomicrobiota bacterium]MCH8512162.1 hypothetical protein [Kiritimatiellia bacterium]
MRKLLAVILLACGLPLWGVDESEWRTVFSPNQRFVVQSIHPEWSQGLSVWAGKSVRLLERETGTSIPFARHVPMRIIVHPDAEKTQLREAQGRGLPRQEIVTPELDQLDHHSLADAFVRACLHRIFVQYKSDSAQKVHAPDGLVYGLSHHLLQGETARTTQLGLKMWQEGRLPPPWRTLGQSRLSAEPETRAAATMAVRWALSSGVDNETLWRQYASGHPPGHLWWIQQFPNVRDLRELQIEWELWLSQRSRTLLTDGSAETLAHDRLRQLLRFRPGEFGLDGDLPRYEFLDFRDLEEVVDEKWVRPMLEQWMVRVQPLRFRQSPEFNEIVDHYLEAARQLLTVGRSTGRTRAEALEAFHQNLRDAEHSINLQKESLQEEPALL